MEIFKKGVKEWERGAALKRGDWKMGMELDFCLSFSSLSSKNIDPSQLKLNNQIY